MFSGPSLYKLRKLGLDAVSFHLDINKKDRIDGGDIYPISSANGRDGKAVIIKWILPDLVIADLQYILSDRRILAIDLYPGSDVYLPRMGNSRFFRVKRGAPISQLMIPVVRIDVFYENYEHLIGG